MATVATIGTVSVVGAGAGTILNNVPLHNTTAQTGTDCPDTENAFWHFVIAPNNGNFHFVDIRLDLGEGLTSFPFTENSGQDDNVFVQVPAGKTIESLVGGEADILSDDGSEPNQFNLSHVCPGVTPPNGNGPPPNGTTPTNAAPSAEGTTPPGGTTPSDQTTPQGAAPRAPAPPRPVTAAPSLTG